MDKITIVITAEWENKTMGKAQPVFTPEYRQEAVKLVLESGRHIADVARSLGINANTLGKWVHKARYSSNPEELTAVSLEKENQELRRHNAQLLQDNASLKKRRPGSRA